MSSSAPAAGEARSRQKQVGAALREDTRNRILRAAGEEFTAHGYQGATVTRLAGAAGVSVQTLYLAWGSKRALLRGYTENALAGERGSPANAGAHLTDLPLRERLIGLAELVAEVAGRAATAWQLYRDAAAVDAEIAADWQELQLLRRGTIARILGDIPEDALADGLTRDEVVDTAWAIASPESYELLVRRLGYTPPKFRAWMEQTLTAAILGPRESL